MLRLVVSVVVVVAAFLFSDVLLSPTVAQESGCPEGTLPSPDGDICAPVVDRTNPGEFDPYDGPVPPDPSGPPNGVGADSGGGMPEPQGSYISGVTYKAGHLDGSEGAAMDRLLPDVRFGH